MASPQLIKPIVERPANLTDMVLEAIQNAIIDKSVAPGSHISEASMAAALEVSKTPVREALLRLRHIGLVVPAERGMRVVTPSPELIRNAYELRAGVERSAAQLAAERASEDQLAIVEAAAQDSLERAKAKDSEGFRACDAEFHAHIAAACRNDLLAGAVSDTLILTRALRARDVRTTGDSVVCGQEHIAISEALRRRDGETAGRRAQAHITHVMTMVLAAYADAAEGN
ncbi:GntR family transcriptional regulator [Mycolicibacterium sp.]|uniref:GntR family transcriptional regulator n=1 Tax=Mycolicibacterium sp. TaxID=2320850 RepID=UPI003D0988E8